MRNLSNADLLTLLDQMRACPTSREWVGERTLKQALIDCNRMGWILLFIEDSRSGLPNSVVALVQGLETAYVHAREVINSEPMGGLLEERERRDRKLALFDDYLAKMKAELLPYITE